MLLDRNLTKTGIGRALLYFQDEFNIAVSESALAGKSVIKVVERFTPQC